MTNNKQQTAVEWLQSIELERDLTLADWKQAKQIEKEQIAKACNAGFDDGIGFIEEMKYKNAEDYYEKTYGDKQ